MEYIKKTLKEALDLNKISKLVLPNFQRGFVWKVEQQQRLLASFMLEMPIGSVLTLEGVREDFAARDICTPQVIEPAPECLYLLDGQQRVSTLKAIFSNLFAMDNWRQSWDALFTDLRNRWFIKLDENTAADFFGLKNLKFEHIRFKTGEPEQLLESIIAKKILVGNANHWFHPGFNPRDAHGNAVTEVDKRKIIAREAAQDFLVPLYELYDFGSSNPIHKLSLDRISSKIAHDLEVQHEQDDEGAILLLNDVEPDIRDLYRDEETTKISLAWQKLAINWATDVRKFFENILSYELSQIHLPAEEINRAFATFESINKPGTPLDIYDLIAAKAARNRGLDSLSTRIKAVIDEELTDIEALTDKVIGAKPSLIEFKSFSLMADEATPSKVVRNQYLNLLSILTHVEYGNTEDINKTDFIKRPKILSVTTEDINDSTTKVITSIKRAFAFLHVRCGLEKPSSLNYELMILPIAYALSNDSFWCSPSHLNKIEYWYWSSLFSGSYRENQNGRCMDDVKALFEWLNGESNPFESRATNIFNAQGYSDFDVLSGQNIENSTPTAIHDGILRYILSKQPHDFIKGVPEIRLTSWDIACKKTVEINGKNYELSVQDHHIFPLSATTTLFESSKSLRSNPKHPLNSPLNRTYISAASNSIISDETPANYFPYVSQHAQDEHCIPMDIKAAYEKTEHETTEQHHLRLLKSRFELLQRDVRMELKSLIS